MCRFRTLVIVASFYVWWYSMLRRHWILLVTLDPCGALPYRPATTDGRKKECIKCEFGSLKEKSNTILHLLHLDTCKFTASGHVLIPFVLYNLMLFSGCKSDRVPVSSSALYMSSQSRNDFFRCRDFASCLLFL